MPGGFAAWDWAVVALVLVATTWIGKRMAGRQATVRDYFLGGRQLPWWAVAGSIVATEVSAVTFLSLPFVVYRDGGDLTYLQLGIGAIVIGKLIAGRWIIPRYFDSERYSPYDVIGDRMGEGARRVATAAFMVGGVLGQAARVYLTAVVLELLLFDELTALHAATGIPPLVGSITAIGIVAIAWTWVGGIAAVVWTDAILFLLLVVGLLSAAVVAVSQVDYGVGAVLNAANDAGKLHAIDLELTLDRPYTLLAALLAYVPWCVGVFASDQLLAQRLFCCADARSAKRALLWSNASVLVTALAAFVGIALYAFYQQTPLAGQAAELVAEKGDRVFPIFILQELPTGLKGLVIAGVFAAAISSLDSILAALAQTTLVTLVPERRRSVATSRVLTIVFGVALCAMAVAMESVHARYPSILDLALAMAGYTVGAMLGGVLLALWPMGRDGRGYLISAPLAVAAVLAKDFLFDEPIAWTWRAPLGLVIAWGGGWLLSRRRKPDA